MNNSPVERLQMPQEAAAVAYGFSRLEMSDGMTYPNVRNPAVFGLLSAVPGVRIMDNAVRKQHIADTIDQIDDHTLEMALQPKEDGLTVQVQINRADRSITFTSIRRIGEDRFTEVIQYQFVRSEEEALNGHLDHVAIDMSWASESNLHTEVSVASDGTVQVDGRPIEGVFFTHEHLFEHMGLLLSADVVPEQLVSNLPLSGNTY